MARLCITASFKIIICEFGVKSVYAFVADPLVVMCMSGGGMVRVSTYAN